MYNLLVFWWCGLQTTVADDGPSDDTAPPDDFEWKPVSKTKMTVVSSTTETRVFVHSKPFADISSFHDLDSHAAEVIIIWNVS